MAGLGFSNRRPPAYMKPDNPSRGTTLPFDPANSSRGVPLKKKRMGMGMGFDEDDRSGYQTGEYRGGARMERGPYEEGDATFQTAAVDEGLKKRWESAEGDAAHEDATEQWRQEQRARGRSQRDIDMDEYDTQESMRGPDVDGRRGWEPDDYGYERRQYIGPIHDEVHDLPEPAGPDDEDDYWDKSSKATDELFAKWREKLKAKGLSDEEIEEIIGDVVGLHD